MSTEFRGITMTGSPLTHPTSELVDSSFAQVLHAKGPDRLTRPSSRFIHGSSADGRWT